jgi:hypothetical protein
MDCCCAAQTVALALCALLLAGAAGADDFDDLVRRVATPAEGAQLAPETDVALAAKVSDEAVASRKGLVIRHGAGLEARKVRSAKHQLDLVMCRLLLGQDDEVARQMMARWITYRGQDDDFPKSSLARMFHQFRDWFDPELVETVRREMTTYDGHFRGGTENHATMHRTIGYLFGMAFPQETFVHDLTGAQVAEVCRKYMRDYGQAIYRTSMVEYLSPTYHGVNSAPWLNVVEFAADEQARIMARAILDYMMADYALNYHLGLMIPPLQRAKGLMTRSYQLSHARAGSQWLGWLYWGGGNTPEDWEQFAGEQFAPHPIYGTWARLHALSGWTPHPVIRNLGIKRVATPYMVWQARGNWPCIEHSHLNEYGKTRPAHDWEPDPRYHLRSLYVDRDYALGAGYFRENIMDPIVRHTRPFMVAWRSHKPINWLRFAHPYWYTARKREDSDQPLGREDWIGYSPFLRMVHWENAAVLLCDIPERDPYEGQAGKGSPVWLSERTAGNVQEAHLYVPADIEESVETAAGFFLREGEVYVAIRPLVSGARWEECIWEGFRRLVLPGALTGAAIEVGDAREFGSFQAFQQRVAGTELDLSRLEAEGRVVYHTTRAHTLDLRHAGEGWLPEAQINGVRLDFDRWPTCESPYVTCRDQVLDVNDGRQGFTVDWRGDLPEYTYYDLAGGERRTTRRERVENGVLRVE